MISGMEWIWVVIAVLVIFGASRLPLLGRNLGQGIKEFKKGIKEAGKDADDKPAGVEGTSSNGAAAPKAVEPPAPDKLAERRD
jgi:sec-independent protein translocase protein TatA